MNKKINEQYERFNLTPKEMSKRIDGYATKDGTLGEIEKIIYRSGYELVNDNHDVCIDCLNAEISDNIKLIKKLGQCQKVGLFKVKDLLEKYELDFNCMNHDDLESTGSYGKLLANSEEIDKYLSAVRTHAEAKAYLEARTLGLINGSSGGSSLLKKI